MSFADYNEVIQRVLTGRIQDAVFTKNIDKLKELFPEEGTRGGDRITEEFEVARTSPAAAYDKSDVNPVSATNVLVKPFWTKKFYQTAAEVHGIDISNAKPDGNGIDFVERELSQEAESLWDIVFSAFMTQIKADVDSTSVAYSDASLSRSTFPTFASYEEATDATVTLAYMRAMMQNTMVNKKCGPLSGYVGLLQDTVYWTLKPLAAALHTFNASTKSGRAEDLGHPEMADFEGLKIVHPNELPGLTTGDVFMLRKQDVKITPHRTLEIKEVESNRDSTKYTLRVGINCHVTNPGFQGKMTNKD